MAQAVNQKFPSEEPTAEIREAARAVRQTFVALAQEGFTENQALVIVGQMLSAAAKPQES